MTRHLVSLLAPLLLVLTTALPAQAQVELTEEGVQAAMEAPEFVQAFGTCFAGIDHPEEVDLVLIIDENGAATFSKAEPLLMQTTATCVSQAVTKLVFPATGNNFEITYPMPIPEVSAAATDPAHPVVAAKPVYAVQPAPAVMVADDSWKPIYSAGTRKIVSGAVLTALGGALLALPGFALMMWGLVCDQASSSSYNDALCKPLLYTGAVMLIGGVIMVIIGATNIAKGRRLRHKAIQIRDGHVVGLLPRLDFAGTPDGHGGSMVLTWRF
jgi:hypothetical protein